MATTPSAKICRLCQKDVANIKRVKDPQGNYYCQPCFDNAQAAAGGAGGGSAAAAGQRPASPGRASAPTATKAPAKPVSVPLAAPPADDDGPPKDFDFLEPDPPPPPRPQPRAEAAPAAPRSNSLPEFCPACGTKVIASRRLCIKCQRDVTKPYVNKGAAVSGADEAIATWVAGSMRIGLWVAGIALVLFCAWGLYGMFFASTAPFEEFPTSREAAVRQFLASVAKGTDKGYDDAHTMVSFRVREASNNPNEAAFYRSAFKRMNEDFVKKYGADWVSKIKLANEGGDSSKDDVEVMYVLTLGEDQYHIGVQAQIPFDAAVIQRVSRDRSTYPENGKNRFGISEVFEYPPHPREKDEAPRLPGAALPGAGGGVPAAPDPDDE